MNHIIWLNWTSLVTFNSINIINILKFYYEKLSRHYFFSTKTIFCKAQSANKIFFFCPFQRQNFFPNKIKFADRKCFPQKTIAPTPIFKLNGSSLRRMENTRVTSDVRMICFKRRHADRLCCKIFL